MTDLTNLINNSSKLIGTRQVLKAIIQGNNLTQVIIAGNTDEDLKEQIVSECKKRNIPFLIILNKSELGKLCKIQVSCAVVGLLKN